MRSSVEAGVPVRWILRAPAERLSGDLGSARIEALVEDALRELAPDVVHVHHWHGLSPGIARVAKGLGLRVVVTLHDLFTTCPRRFRMPDARSFCAGDSTLADCAACIASDVGPLPPEQFERLLAERNAELQAELAAADVVLAVSAAQRDPRYTRGGLGIIRSPSTSRRRGRYSAGSRRATPAPTSRRSSARSHTTATAASTGARGASARSSTGRGSTP